jgi:hypothetical protein
MGHVVRTKETSTNKILKGKSKGKRPLGRSRHRRESDIKMNVYEVQEEG